MFLLIFSYAKVHDILALRRTCTTIYYYLCDAYFWKFYLKINHFKSKDIDLKCFGGIKAYEQVMLMFFNLHVALLYHVDFIMSINNKLHVNQVELQESELAKILFHHPKITPTRLSSIFNKHATPKLIREFVYHTTAYNLPLERVLK